MASLVFFFPTWLKLSGVREIDLTPRIKGASNAGTSLVSQTSCCQGVFSSFFSAAMVGHGVPTKNLPNHTKSYQIKVLMGMVKSMVSVTLLNNQLNDPIIEWLVSEDLMTNTCQGAPAPPEPDDGDESDDGDIVPWAGPIIMVHTRAQTFQVFPPSPKSFVGSETWKMRLPHHFIQFPFGF